jgi:signal transduction histidine kinase
METLKYINFSDTLLPMAVVVFIIGTGVVLLNQHFQRNLFLQKIKENGMKSLHQQDLLRTNIHVQEQERKRIAQDVHDELGAVLSLMRMNLVLLEQQYADGPAGLLTGLQNARQLSENAIASVRSISHQLMPPQLESFGLIETLESVVLQIGQTKQLYIELTTAYPLGDLPWNVNIALYRVLMELINNTLKHAGASQIKIDFSRTGQYLNCRYADNGRGLSATPVGAGLGHKGIEGRVNSLNGILEMGNGLMGGFYASIQIPVYV